jgi:hypothetical protein
MIYAIRPYRVATANRPFGTSGKFSGIGQITPSRRLSAGDEMEAEKNRLLRLAAKTMIDGASKVSASLNNVYNQYGNFVRDSWFRTIASNAALPLIGPYIDSWFRANQAGRAVATIQAGNKLANEWMNKTRDEYLMVFDEAVLEMDPQLAEQTDTAFEWVSAAYRRNADLMKGIQDLPQVIVGRAEDAFFGGLKTSFPETMRTLADIGVALGNLVKAGLVLTKGVAKVINNAGKVAAGAGEGMGKVPWLVLGGVGILLVWYLVKS